MLNQEHTKNVNIAGYLSGLLVEAEREIELTRYAWPLFDDPSPGKAIPPAQCWRTVSQRTLSHPIAWLGAPLIPAPGGNPYVATMQALELPSEALVDRNSTDTDQIVQFYDNNSDTERGRIEGLVLIGIRAHMVVAQAGFEDIFSGPSRRNNAWSRAIPAFAEHYLSFRITHTVGRTDPWVNDTPMIYIARPDRHFVTVPPLIWSARNVHAEWINRVPDFQPSGDESPTLAVLSANVIDYPATASLLVEGLFVPDPDICPDLWPGMWCPPQAIRGHRQYDPEYYKVRRQKLAQVTSILNNARNLPR